MKPIFKNTIAVITGVITGSLVNMYIVGLSANQLKLDPKDPEYMTKLGKVLETAPLEMFIYPFFAHALGTLVGALVAAMIATTPQKMKIALGIGVFFLLGGIMASVMIPSPLWFIIVDIVFAYLPMGFLGGSLVLRFFKNSNDTTVKTH